MDIAEAKVTVSGRVQGVWFRTSTKDTALSAGVRGYVRNLPDGRVEAIIQGQKVQVEPVIEFMRTGPPGALVREIEIEWREPERTYESFTVEY